MGGARARVTSETVRNAKGGGRGASSHHVAETECVSGVCVTVSVWMRWIDHRHVSSADGGETDSERTEDAGHQCGIHHLSAPGRASGRAAGGGGGGGAGRAAGKKTLLVLQSTLTSQWSRDTAVGGAPPSSRVSRRHPTCRGVAVSRVPCRACVGHSSRRTRAHQSTESEITLPPTAHEARERPARRRTRWLPRGPASAGRCVELAVCCLPCARVCACARGRARKSDLARAAPTAYASSAGSSAASSPKRLVCMLQRSASSCSA